MDIGLTRLEMQNLIEQYREYIKDMKKDIEDELGRKRKLSMISKTNPIVEGSSIMLMSQLATNMFLPFMITSNKRGGTPRVNFHPPPSLLMPLS